MIFGRGWKIKVAMILVRRLPSNRCAHGSLVRISGTLILLLQVRSPCDSDWIRHASDTMIFAYNSPLIAMEGSECVRVPLNGNENERLRSKDPMSLRRGLCWEVVGASDKQTNDQSWKKNNAQRVLMSFRSRLAENLVRWRAMGNSE
jgi:hypothetical protein